MTEVFTIKTSHYIIGAVGIVAALSWNHTIQELINKIFPMPKEEAMANIVYSIIITLLLVILITLLPDTTSELSVSTQEKIKESMSGNYINRWVI